LPTYHHSHFLAATLDFTSFFTTAFLGAAHFVQLAVFGLDFTLVIVCCKAGILPLMVVAINFVFFFLYAGRCVQ